MNSHFRERIVSLRGDGSSLYYDKEMLPPGFTFRAIWVGSIGSYLNRVQGDSSLFGGSMFPNLTFPLDTGHVRWGTRGYFQLGSNCMRQHKPPVRLQVLWVCLPHRGILLSIFRPLILVPFTSAIKPRASYISKHPTSQLLSVPFLGGFHSTPSGK